VNKVDFPTEYPLSFGQIQHKQAGDKEIQQLLKSKPDIYKKKDFKHSNETYSLVTKEDKIVLPKKLQKKATEWYHLHLLHPGKTCIELTLGHHYCWVGMTKTILAV
jgi:hypothetical protein